jgi:hypothetical protein
MANNVKNSLKIHCEDEKLMNKIKKMIFIENEEGNQRFTMKKMLPIPNDYSNPWWLTDHVKAWRIAIWGTYQDANNYSINESGDTISIPYHTATSPNYPWVETLCKYIQWTLRLNEPDGAPIISVEHKYYDDLMDYGGILEWIPEAKIEYKEYNLIEYAKQYDEDLYKWILETEEELKSGNASIILF